MAVVQGERLLAAPILSRLILSGTSLFPILSSERAYTVQPTPFQLIYSSAANCVRSSQRTAVRSQYGITRSRSEVPRTDSQANRGHQSILIESPLPDSGPFSTSFAETCPCQEAPQARHKQRHAVACSLSAYTMDFQRGVIYIRAGGASICAGQSAWAGVQSLECEVESELLSHFLPLPQSTSGYYDKHGIGRIKGSWRTVVSRIWKRPQG